MYVNGYTDDHIGTPLAEYEVLVQYYSKLISLLVTGSSMTGLLWSHTHELYECIHHHIMTRHHWIVEYFDHTEGKGHSDMKLLLAIIAMELHCGVTASFYDMLKFIKNLKQDFHLLAREMQGKIDKFDPQESSGM